MITAVHTPFGLEHPYEQQPEERTPRQPLAGEMFTVGIVTRPPGEVKGVRIRQVIDGVEQPPVEAKHLPDWQREQEIGVGAEFLERIVRIEQDVWQATLTAPPYGSTLVYTVEADGETFGSYTLKGEAWQVGTAGQFGQRDIIQHYPQPSGNRPPEKGLPPVQQIEWLTDGTSARRVRITFPALPDEGFYALGERYNALNQRGEVIDVRCYEQYKSQGKRTYMPIPFLLSSAGYGLWVESSRWMQFDLCAASPDVWTLEADVGDSALNLHWFQADDPAEITSQFVMKTGKPALPPLWAFGLWMSANEWHTQARVEAEVEASLKHEIQPSVVVIEAWSDETTFYIWNDAQYTPKPGNEAPRYEDFTFPPDGKWTNPKAMVDKLHAENIKLLLWQIPVLKQIDEAHAQHDADRAYFEAEGYGVHDPDGSLHKVRPFWFRNGWLWDVTNPAARDWWLGKREYLLRDVGIDGFKTDGGEHLWSTEVVFADGRKGDEVWNEYPQLYTEAYYTFANHHREALTFSRAGFTGSQKSPAHWAGDENSTWDAYRHSILAGLSAGMSGISFWGWDIGGFSGPIPTAELFLRSTAMAAFCPIFQYHSEYNPERDKPRDRTPWNMQKLTDDERIIPIFRRFTNVRHNLMPYIWQEAQHSAATGEPMMRALKVTHPEASDYQYFFGRDLLICPVVEPDVSEWSVYLPPGSWRDFWTREAYEGGKTIIVPAALDSIPVFVRARVQIPVRMGESGRLGEAVELSGEATGSILFD